MHKVIKGHYKRVLAERNRTLFARSLAAKRKNFLKDAHKFRLKQSVLSVLEIIPKENLHELRIKLGYNVPAASVQSIPQALVDRIVFLPPNEFTNLATMWGLHPKRNTPAIALANYAFLNAKFCDMRWVKENAVHEVTHLVCSLLKKHANPKYQEALPVALELFSTLEETNRIRQHALAKAERTYVGKFDSREYVHGVNQGKKIFLTAYDLMKTHGREAAIEFFQDLFLSDTLSDNAINNAVKFVKENYSK
jgi:hypothetical protein